MACILAYDSGCGPCSRFKGVVGFLDANRVITPVGLAEAEREGLLRSVPPARRRRSFHLLFPAGRIESGASAIPPLLSLLPMGGLAARVVEQCPPVSKATKYVYGVLSRLHDAGACKRHG